MPKITRGRLTARINRLYLRWVAYGLILLFVSLLQAAPRLFPAFFGAHPVPLVPFVVCIAMFEGPMVGAAFGVLSATLIGRSLTDPTSPMFIFSCVLSCTIAGASFVMYRRINGRKRQK